MVATSRASRPAFSWIVLALGAGLALLFAAAFVLVARHGGREARLGWEPGPADDGRVVVAAVDPSGPASGVLAPGDRVVAVDGDRRVNWASFDWLMLPVPTRASYTLAAARNGREFEARLPVVVGTRPGWQWTAIVRAFVALVLCTTGLTVGLLRPEQRVARLYSLSVLLSAPIFFANPLLLDMLRSSLLTRGEALVVWLCRIHSPFHGAVGFHFAREFPRGSGGARGWGIAQKLFYAWAAIVCAFYNLQYYFMVFRPDLGVTFTWEHPLLWRGLFTIDSLFGPVIFAALPAAIIRNARVETSPGEQRRMRWALFGAVVGFIPILGLFTLRFVQEVLLSGARLVSPETERLLDGVAFLFLAAAPVTLAYAVVKHRVFGIRIVIRRGVRYLLARNVLRAVLVLPLALLVGSVLLNPDRTVGQILFQHPLHLVLIAAAALSLRYRRALRQGIDRRFFREAYDQEQVLLSLVDDIRARDSLTDLSRLVSERLGATLHPERLYLVYRSLEGRDFALEYSSAGSSSGLRIPEDSALVRIMQSRADALEPTVGDAGLPADEREWLSRLGVRLVVPMRTAEGRLVGLILLGDKKSEVPYGRDDRRLLQAVAAQIAILYENTALKRRVAQEEKARREVLSRLAPGEINVVRECPQCGTCYDATVEKCPNDGAPLMLTLPVERTVDGKYQLERVIGTGGMGTVYEATDLRLGRRVALKVLLARNFGNPSALRRFEREAQASARLRHPNIVTVHDYGTLGSEGAYLVMELLRGTTLRAELDRVGTLHPPLAAEWFDQILAGVEAAHSAGVIHRDLKPDNVIVTRAAPDQEVLKILDFGLAKLSFGDPPDPKSLTVPGTVLGTLRYMSPEQLSGEPTDERSDVFSIGVLVAEALIGRHPFHAPTTAAMVTGILQEPFRVPGEGAEVKELDRVLQRCLAKDRTARYASVAEARRELIPAIQACPPFPGSPRDLWGHDTIADDASTRRTEGG
jgi:eukaryotic-like serine/threonine-protein kinase